MGAVSTGLFLSKEYVDTLTEKRIKQFIDNGLIRKSSATGQYELTQTGMSVFIKKSGESFTIKNDGKDIKVVDTIDSSIDLGETMGLTKSNSPSASNVQSEEKPHFEMTFFYERLGIKDNPELQQKFIEQLNKVQGVTIEDGVISYPGTNKAAQAVQNAIFTFQDNNKQQYTNNNKVTVIVNEDNQAMVNMMVEDNLLEQNSTTGQYTIKNSNMRNEALQHATPTVSGTHLGTIDGTIQSTKTIATNTEGLPKDNDASNLTVKLRDNKDERKRLETAAKASYTNWVKVPENQDAVTLYVAANKYSKQVKQRVNELVEGATDATGINADGSAYSISKEYNITGGEVFDLFINRLPEEERAEILKQVMEFANSDDPKIQTQLQRVLKGTYEKIDETTLNGPNGNTYKVEAAKLLFMEGLGLKPSDLLHMLAVNDVMGSRSQEQIESDNKYFIEHQSKDYVRNLQAQQDIADTTVYFSKKARKAAGKDENGINTDIGNRGRDLVRQAPQIFCDEVSENEFNQAKGTDMAEEYFTSVITEQERDNNGKLTGKKITRTVYYKFDSQKYKDFMTLACDPDAASDPANAQKLKDLNMTLQEGRDGLELHIPDKNGHMVPIVNLLGNNNGKVDNSELNAWRDLAETAGISTDNNPTYVKRLGDFAKKLGINGVLFVGAPVLGNLGSQLLNFANSTIPQVIKSPDTYFTTPDRTFTTPDKYVVTPAETITVGGQTFTHNINIDGVDYPITFQGPDTYINVGGDTIKVEGDTFTIKGETYKIDGKDVQVDSQNPGINVVKVAVATTVATAAGWLFNDRANIHAKGRANDDLYDPTIYVQQPDERETTATFQFKEYTQSVGLGEPQFGGRADDLATMRRVGLTYDKYSNINDNNAAQPVLSDMGKAGIKPDSTSLTAPAEIYLNDDHNVQTAQERQLGTKIRSYTYKLLTSQEVQQEGLDPQNGPYYILTAIKDNDNDQNNNDLFDGHKEIHRLRDTVVTYEYIDGKLTPKIEYLMEQDTGMAGAGQSSARQIRIQQWWDPNNERYGKK